MDKMFFNFHCGGKVSKEEMNIIYQDEYAVVLSDGKDLLVKSDFDNLSLDKNKFVWGSEYFIFSKINGKCLNDNNIFGCYRTI